jgi:hypothetical protein
VMQMVEFGKSSAKEQEGMLRRLGASQAPAACGRCGLKPGSHSLLQCMASGCPWPSLMG